MLMEYQRGTMKANASEPVLHKPAIPAAEALKADTQIGVAGRFSEQCAVSTTL